MSLASILKVVTLLYHVRVWARVREIVVVLTSQTMMRKCWLRWSRLWIHIRIARDLTLVLFFLSNSIHPSIAVCRFEQKRPEMHSACCSVCKGHCNLISVFRLCPFGGANKPQFNFYQAQIAIRPRKHRKSVFFFSSLFFLSFSFLFSPTQPPQSSGQTVIENGGIKMQTLALKTQQSVCSDAPRRTEKNSMHMGKNKSLSSGLELRSEAFLGTFTKRI